MIRCEGDLLHVILCVGTPPGKTARQQGRYAFFDSWPCRQLEDPKQEFVSNPRFIHYVFLAYLSPTFSRERAVISRRAMEQLFS